MDALELLELIQKGETSSVQFKERLPEAYKLGTEMVAFSNSNGGLIIVGVNDKTGELNGLSFHELQAANQLLANVASDHVKSPIYITTETIKIEQHHILVATISEGLSKPHMDNKGMIWVKNGSDKRKVVAKEEIARLLQSGGNLFADETIVPSATSNNIDKDFFKSFIKAKTGKDLEELNMPLLKILENMGFSKNGSLTLAGILLFGVDPQQFKPTFTIQCISFVGNEISSTQYKDKPYPFTGKLSELFNQTISFINRNTKSIQVEESFNSKPVPEIPKDTIEELLVNSIVHRDYFINSTIKVFIFDNRIEIISPGNLPNTLSIENIKSGTSIPRNPIIFTNIRYLLPFVGVGSGIPRALSQSPDLDLMDDKERELFIATINRSADN